MDKEEEIKLRSELDESDKLNGKLVKEIVRLKGIKTSGENRWIKIWIFIGVIMFLAGIWESLVTMFFLDKEVVKMTTQQIVFASVGFVFVSANESLATMANNIGKHLVEKFK